MFNTYLRGKIKWIIVH